MCDTPRESLMAYVDNEVDSDERVRIQAHLKTCAECREIVQSFADFNQLTVTAAPVLEPTGGAWQSYYDSVCRKIAASGAWTIWSAGALLLTISGTLILFGLPRSPIHTMLGISSLMTGCGVLWLSHFCRSCR